MPITLPPDLKADARASIVRYFEENMEEPIGDLAAGLLLDFFVEEIGPAVYNQAIADVQQHLSDRVAELDVNLHEEPLVYWRSRR